MLRIQFHLDGFGHGLPHQIDLNCVWVELLWAAITVGRREWHHVVMHGMYSMYELVYRGCLLFANLADAPANRITRSNAYDALDPSEKGAVSYFMGLTLAKLFCERVLDAPWMMHLAVYLNQLHPAIFNSRRRPDLVGQDSARRWIIAESKGRTNDFDPQALDAAKVQTAAIGLVGGQIPYLKFGLLSHFSSPNNYLTVHCADPEETSEDSSDLRIEPEQLFIDYYQPFLDLLEERRRRENNAEISVRIAELDITVGIKRRAYEIVRRREYDDLIHQVDEAHRDEGSIRRKSGGDGYSR